MTEETVKFDDDTALKDAAYEAGQSALKESQMVSSQAQRLFYEYWNAGGHDAPLAQGITQFKKCMNMAEEIRKVVTEDFSDRLKSLDQELRKKHKGIIIPSASMWRAWRLGG